MSNKIPCICIDDTNKPSAIPQEKWVKEGQKYHITHIYIMKNMQGIQGAEIAEHDISECAPYNCYRLDRFSFKPEDLDKLIEMMKFSSGFNELKEFDVNKYIEQLETVEELIEI